MSSAASPPEIHEVPTVRGPVPAAELGSTLVHEHLFVLSSEFQSNYPELWDREAGVDAAVRQLDLAHTSGVRTIVDMTVIGQGRDIGLIGEVAARTPVNLVVATGVYTLDGIPPFARFRGPGCAVEAEDPLIDLLTGDITTGIGGTRIRAGLVKFAHESATPAGSAERMAVVVGEVHRRTGVPVVVHSDPFSGNGVELVALLGRQGVAPGHVVVAHAGDSADLGYLRALADTGCLLGYDRYGMTTFAPDEQRNATLSALVRAGHAAQLLVSQDHASHIDYLTVEQRDRLYPEWSYTHLFDRVLPRLREQPGIDETTITTLLVDNPRRLLTRVGAPAPARAKENTRVTA